MITKSDVLLLPYTPPRCSNCGEKEIHWTLALDLRAIGTAQHLGDMCDDCASDQVDRLRESLPDDNEEFDEAAALEAAMDRRP